MNKETQQITDYFIELLSQKDAPIMPDELKKILLFLKWI